jgi:hypothetical protein
VSARLKELSGDQQRAGIAAAALFFTLLLPWYSQSRVIGGTIQSERLSAFRVFSFVEAAVLLTAAAVLYLLYARSQRKGFHLPGGDGWAITIAGGWSVFLLVWRLFDKPEFNGGPVGVEWGLFVAIVVAGVVVAAGQKLRAANQPEPPNPAAEPLWETPARPERGDRERRRPVDPSAVTRTLREDRPSWEGDPPERQ